MTTPFCNYCDFFVNNQCVYTETKENTKSKKYVCNDAEMNFIYFSEIISGNIIDK